MQNANIVVSRLPAKQAKAVQIAILKTMEFERAAGVYRSGSEMVMGIVVDLAESGMVPERAAAALEYIKANGRGKGAPVTDKALTEYFSQALCLVTNLNLAVTTGAADKGGLVTSKIKDRLYRTNKKGEQTGLASLRGLYNIVQEALVKSLPADKQKAKAAEQEAHLTESRRTFAKGFITKSKGADLVAKTEAAILEVIGAAIVKAVEDKNAKAESVLREMLHEFK